MTLSVRGRRGEEQLGEEESGGREMDVLRMYTDTAYAS